jgi:hypothetical protein
MAKQQIGITAFDSTQLLPGDILLFHVGGFSIISAAIRWLTESYWNHVGMYDGEGHVIEALMGRGVVKTPLEKYIKNKSLTVVAVRFKEEAFANQEEYNKGILIAAARMEAKVGTKYDLGAIVGLWIKLVLAGTWKKGKQYVPVIGNPFQRRERVFCSELICESCWMISSLYPMPFQGTTKQKCDTTTPGDIAKAKTVRYMMG